MTSQSPEDTCIVSLQGDTRGHVFKRFHSGTWFQKLAFLCPQNEKKHVINHPKWNKFLFSVELVSLKQQQLKVGNWWLKLPLPFLFTLHIIFRFNWLSRNLSKKTTKSSKRRTTRKSNSPKHKYSSFMFYLSFYIHIHTYHFSSSSGNNSKSKPTPFFSFGRKKECAYLCFYITYKFKNNYKCTY